ncbi:hypothetical protein TNCV_3799251 [Trichonephila clavipes]|nr:hypothetical protein TNCV_3799251 [Trichonephila clavipes]
MIKPCHRIEPQIQVNSKPPSLQALRGWYQGQLCFEGFTKVVFMRGEQPFTFRKSHTKGGNVCNGHVNMFNGRVINRGLFSVQMSSSLTSKGIVGIFSLGKVLKLAFMHDTYEKEMHTDQTVSVFGMVSLWVDAQTFFSLVEMLMLTPIEMTSWMLKRVLMLGGYMML